MKVESYKIIGWKKREVGLLISENEEWILARHIPVDYVIDGFKLYQKKFVKERRSKTKEIKIERVLELKNVSSTKPEGFMFRSVFNTLKWSEIT